MSNRTLVAYFSASGVTAKVASSLASSIDADLHEIKPAIPYAKKDLNWQDKHSRSSVEMNDPSARPELSDGNLDLKAYNRVFIGFPIWWYTAPRIIQTFLERFDFVGKTIILFATSGGSGMGRTAKDLASSCPGAVIRDGQILRRGVSAEELKCWADKF